MKTPAESGEAFAFIDEEINPAAWACVQGHVDQQAKLVDSVFAIHRRDAEAAGWRVLGTTVTLMQDGRVMMHTRLEAT